MRRVRRFITKSVFGRQYSTFITEIPSENIHIIFIFLSAPDQICLSLSCKHLYACFLSFLNARGISLPQLLQREKRPTLCPNVEIEKRPRIKLLRQIQNKRWRYCYECWNLHPRSAWHSPRLYHFPKTYPGTLQLYGQFDCMLLAGQVDICPCLTIAFLGKLDLMEKLRSIQYKDHIGNEHYYNEILFHGSGLGFVRHICKFNKHPLAKVIIVSDLQVLGRNLYVDTFHKFVPITFPEFISQGLSSGMKTPLICPLKDTRKWMKQFFFEAGSDFSGFSCAEEFDVVDTGNISMYNLQMRIRRNLGLDKWPDEIWHWDSRR